jgi:hypothetical protein
MAIVPRSNRALVLAAVLTIIVSTAVTTQPAVAVRATSKLPLTFGQAQARNQTVDWGPQCDTSTGKVAVPTGYAPPCVAPWKGTNNGGNTAPGVTRNTITVALYQAQPDALQQSLFERSGSDESLAQEAATTQQYIDVFSAHYQLYGRRVKLVPVKASGPPDDDIAAEADAIKVATQVHAFASFGGPGQTSAYAKELAARGVLCVGDCVIAEPRVFLDRNAPYVWPTLAAPEQATRHWAEFVGTQLAGDKATHAGDPALQAKPRVFGVLHYDDAAGTFRRSVSAFEQRLGAVGVRPAATVGYSLDLNTAQSQSRTLVARMKDAGVTSVILAGDPLFPIFLTREATSQGYFPEWIVLGYAFTDTAVFGRQYDQQQWSHAFGVSLLPARTTEGADELANLITWQTGQHPSASTYRELAQAPLLFFTGVHLAGPDLTADTFRAGLFSYPPPATTVSTRLHMSWGRHHIWNGVDLTAGDDATVIWWDPIATGPDEVGTNGAGLYRYADAGTRYLPGAWPKTKVGLYDDATSTTVLTSIPPAAAPPSYPSPAPAR